MCNGHLFYNECEVKQKNNSTHEFSLSPFSLYRFACLPGVRVIRWNSTAKELSNHAAHIYNRTPLPSQTQSPLILTITFVCMYTSFDSVAWRILFSSCCFLCTAQTLTFISIRKTSTLQHSILPCFSFFFSTEYFSHVDFFCIVVIISAF